MIPQCHANKLSFKYINIASVFPLESKGNSSSILHLFILSQDFHLLMLPENFKRQTKQSRNRNKRRLFKSADFFMVDLAKTSMGCKNAWMPSFGPESSTSSRSTMSLLWTIRGRAAPGWSHLSPAPWWAGRCHTDPTTLLPGEGHLQERGWKASVKK